MSTETNKKNKWKKPDHWPDEVRLITFDEGDKLGVRDADNMLFWDGKELALHKTVGFGKWVWWFAAVIAGSTLGLFFIELYHTIFSFVY